MKVSKKTVHLNENMRRKLKDACKGHDPFTYGRVITRIELGMLDFGDAITQLNNGNPQI